MTATYSSVIEMNNQLFRLWIAQQLQWLTFSYQLLKSSRGCFRCADIKHNKDDSFIQEISLLINCPVKNVNKNSSIHFIWSKWMVKNEQAAVRYNKTTAVFLWISQSD